MLNVAADAVPLLVQGKLEQERFTTSQFMLAVLNAGVTGIASAMADGNESAPAGWKRAAQFDNQPTARKDAGGQWMMKQRGNRCLLPV